jgi:outer membrane lipoprotein LolB
MQPVMRCLWLAVIAAVLAACVSVPALPPSSEKPTIYTGRFAVSYIKDGATQREQGGFEWKIVATNHAEKTMQLSLLSPLGTTVALIALDPHKPAQLRASLTTPTQTDTAPDLDALMENTLGWRLPLSQLLPWIAKTPPTQSPADWQIAVASRHDSGLPRLMTANNPALELTVRLVFEP